MEPLVFDRVAAGFWAGDGLGASAALAGVAFFAFTGALPFEVDAALALAELAFSACATEGLDLGAATLRGFLSASTPFYTIFPARPADFAAVYFVGKTPNRLIGDA